MISGVKYIT